MEVTQSEQTAVAAAMPPAERAALALNSSQTEYDLRVLATKHASIQVIKDKAGRDQAHGAAMEVKRARTTVERVGKEARDDATKFSKAIIAEQNRLVDIIIAEEQRLLALRDAWDIEQEKIREAAAAAERLRVEQIRQRIELIASFERLALNCRTSAAVERLGESLDRCDLTGMDEFEAEAQALHARMTQRLTEIRNDRIAEEVERSRIKAEQEAEAARIAAERAELDRQRAEAAAKAQAEAERLAQERAALEAARAEFEQRQKAHEARERADLEAKRAADLEAEQAAMASAAVADDIEPAVEQGAAVESIHVADATPEQGQVEALPDAAAPSAVQLIQAVAETFGVSPREARDWLVERAVEIEVAKF